MKKETLKTISIATVFAIAMSFLETAIVIYLRKLYYPAGFSFPLIGFIEPEILNIEWIRETATIIMLVCIATLSAKKFYPRIAFFLYSFAIWDIFYYVWLKIFLNWPSSFLTWDLLFLIPWPWAGPVLAPVICSITMIILAICILHCEGKVKKLELNKKEWSFLIIGSLFILYTFLVDYGKLVFNGYSKNFFLLANNREFLDIISLYTPINYNWSIFILGETIIILGIILFYSKYQK